MLTNTRNIKALKSVIRRIQTLGRNQVSAQRKASSFNNANFDFDSQAIDIINYARPYTMTTPERLFSLIEAVRYIISNNIEGDFVECGVWKGGSVIAMILTLMSLDIRDRDIYLFDTFEGMTAPTEDDVMYNGQSAADILKENSHYMCFSAEEEVRANISCLDYPFERIHFVKGSVEETLPTKAPSNISLLRLDTDWYQSTRHELLHLYPRLECSGVLIIDDYGWWQGARKAVDEYFQERFIKILLHRIDETARIAVKQ
jgi:hypothetical protein